MNGIERTITVEPGGSWGTTAPDGRLMFNDIDTAGVAPPFGLPSWWPWAVAVIAIGGLWYLTREGRHGPKGDRG